MNAPTPAPLAAVILAAGLGKRMKSKQAKVLHDLCGVPLVAHPADLALSIGADPVVVVVGHQAEEVSALLHARYGERVRTVRQPEQLGTAHAVSMAEKTLKRFHGRVAILSGDVPLLTADTLRRLGERMDEAGSPLGLIAALLPDPHGYGRLVRDAAGRPIRIVEHKDATDDERRIPECNMGLYLIDRSFLFSNLKKLGRDNAQGEYYLPDLVRLAVEAGRPVTVIEASLEETSGVNDRAQLALLARVRFDQVRRDLMREGVSLLDPATAYIEPGALIGPDTRIGPNVHIDAACRIGPDCRIETGCVLRRAQIGEGVTLKPYTVIEESDVRSGAVLGPFAHLRPGSVIGEGCHVGNFVETKKTELKPGAKANHLSYLGDAVIGARTNVGAGTITCNYDGYRKFKTEVGEEVLIGSDTQLIAPVKVPNRVVLGAGTSLTGSDGPIPEGALVVTRARAVIIEGYRDRLQKKSEAAKAGATKKTETRTRPGKKPGSPSKKPGARPSQKRTGRGR